MFFNEMYKASDLCSNELVYAERRNKRLLAVSMDKTPWAKWLNLHLSDHLWIDFPDDSDIDSFFKEFVDKIGFILSQPSPKSFRLHE